VKAAIEFPNRALQETIVSIAWKFFRMDALPGHIVERQFSQQQVDPYEGIAATAIEVAVPVLARAFAIPRRALRDGIEPADGSQPMHSRLRFCTKCMKLGYHAGCTSAPAPLAVLVIATRWKNTAAAAAHPLSTESTPAS